MIISVIGSAGRRGDGDKLNQKVYNLCFDRLVQEMAKETTPVVLKSGGAAAMDHLAVRYYLKYPEKVSKLILHLPAYFDNKRALFYGNKDAEISNYYHKLFEKSCEIHSLNELAYISTHKNVIFDIKLEGFFARNIWVGKCEKLIAFTFNNAAVPKDGGTNHTWSKSIAREKLHIDIGQFL